MDFLVEIGCEEIPARFVKPLVEQLERGLCQLVEQQSLAGEEFRTENYATPRRLAILICGMLESQPERTEVVYGPRYEAAYDAEGKPTKACTGFARSKGVDVDALEVFDTDRGKVVGVRMKTGGEPAGKVLAQHLPALVTGLKVQKSMRWGDGSYQFVRPVHWICALAGSDVVEFEFAGIRSGRKSRGHRFSFPAHFEIEVPADYVSLCERHGVMAERNRRRQVISDRLFELAESVGGRPLRDEQLLEEVTDLVEWPVAILGRFEQRFLRLPREVLVAAMRNHQRYFAIEDANGKLVNAFVAIANTPVEDEQPVRHGFERVLTARLNDAEFFFDQDRKTPPRQLVDKLDGMLFQAELGSYLEKAQRIEKLAV
ncbi:MAG: glycine--tRNA ligase subunit beta, partial [Deltaproteobacteria bacterium]